MKANIKNSVDMAKVTMSVCEKKAEVISMFPALNSAYTRFKSKMEEVDKTIKEQIAVITGITEEKKLSRARLIKSTDAVTQVIMAFAHLAQDVNLEKEVHFSASQLKKMNDEVLAQTAHIIYDKGINHTAEIAAFGADTSSLATLLADLNEFEQVSHTPREALETRKTSTHKLESLIHDVSDLMKNELDRLIHVLPDEYADFKETYKGSRKIISRHGKVKKPGPTPNAV